MATTPTPLTTEIQKQQSLLISLLQEQLAQLQSQKIIALQKELSDLQIQQISNLKAEIASISSSTKISALPRKSWSANN